VVDVVIVGAGFSGLFMLHRVRQLGLTARVFEAGDDVGGTWYWNRYPGARCDIESVEYSYSFDDDLQQEWVWSERFATQPEILSYLQHVADRFDLRRDIQFSSRVIGARFDDSSTRWTVSTDDGKDTTCQFLIAAVGCLSSANMPELPGRDSFTGATYHTGHWPHEGVDFTGLRVGVIGTGSSAVQSIPLIAEQASHLTVFQRTPSYAVPARNEPLSPEELNKVKANYAELREGNKHMSGAYGSRTERGDRSAFSVSDEERRQEYQERWDRGGLILLHGFNDLLLNKEANETAAEFVREKIGEIVSDPAIAAKLTPTHVIGCKRLCLGTGYYETYNRENVTLVDLRSDLLETVTPTGIRAGGVDHELDCIVYATGFDAMTGSLLKMNIEGPTTSLAEAWAAGPRTFLGLGVHGLPNLFIITGPGSPSVLSNMVGSIEFHVEWIAECLRSMLVDGKTRIEATEAAQDRWVDHVNAIANMTLFPSCNSWYLGANVPGKPRVFMPLPGHPGYMKRADAIAAAGYEGFELQ
jgi:cation diffusion facilitator CzcD-associated flavoprotein CzcO